MNNRIQCVLFFCFLTLLLPSHAQTRRGAEEKAGDILNPVIRGFNPDPSIIRVDSNYYIATSSFEWYPGVPLYHSRDLASWRLVGHALHQEQVDLTNIPSSAGVYAPSLHYHEGVYYLVYTVVQTAEEGWPMYSTPNYIISTEDIKGAWSKPVYLNSVGFDPSLFFDGGKSYLVTMVMDFRKKEPTMGKIGLQEIDLQTGETLSDLKIIARFDNIWGTEGPHIYKRNGYYYLMVAQGGTFYDHMVTISRSKQLEGPYEVSPDWPLLTSRGDTSLVMQRAGHGCLVETLDGRWFMSYLASRPIMSDKRSPLGRESCIQEVFWNESGWLELVGGGKEPLAYGGNLGVEAPAFDPLPNRDEFESNTLRVDYQTLRQPFNESWLVLDDRSGVLKLRGRRPPTSLSDVSLVARRMTSYNQRAEVMLSFDPSSYRQKAGLSAFYDARHFYFLSISHDEQLGKCVELIGFERGKYQELAKAALDDSKDVRLKFEVLGDSLAFSYSTANDLWKPIGDKLFFGNLSDEQEKGSGFTGTMAALIVMDAINEKKWATFDYFDLSEK